MLNNHSDQVMCRQAKDHSTMTCLYNLSSGPNARFIKTPVALYLMIIMIFLRICVSLSTVWPCLSLFSVKYAYGLICNIYYIYSLFKVLL